MTPSPELIERLVRGHDVVAATAAAGVRPVASVTWTRRPAPPDWLVDGEDESPVDRHRRAHADGRPSEATVRYGAGIDPAAVADRLAHLGALAAETGLLRAVCPRPGDGGAARPGSWGVEDVGVIAAARALCPDVPWVRPDWRALGPGACQIAVAFGATDWQMPEDDPTDPDRLARGVGARAEAR